ncbi:MAG: hypothetical protein HOU81_11290 [Hamadaea sp.]|uniref:hypothetical protein n=1 Tax=Hamadaea sp. TaxID=2024425 RepID=UPI00181A2EE1|nr:hypothetical protein [Hamadaea sp.]NUR71396.1 hypothetical protein [Hamadaea sp.]NUT22693.1 hypothetical protein [Hamadaea sp.]
MIARKERAKSARRAIGGFVGSTVDKDVVVMIVSILLQRRYVLDRQFRSAL